MNRLKLFTLLITGIAMLALALVSDAQGSRKSDGKVKATATATKVNDKGEQTVTITLDIEKGWHLYANPVNHNKEFLDGAKTKVKVSAKGNVQASVRYPAGKTHTDKDDRYDIYEGVVKIEAKVKRSGGDTSPLEVVINVQACNSSICLEPGTVKLMVP
jgi:DsbC/DsbD-like thiol-disulfide interchange protein